MSTALVIVTGELGQARSILLPPVVLAKIDAFLSAGTTGQIVLDVKDGRVLAYKLTEAGRVPMVQFDNKGNCGDDGDH